MRFVTPAGNLFPAGTPLRVTVGVPQLSVARAVPSWASGTVAKHPDPPLLRLTVTGGGAVITGFSVSFTETVKMHDVVLPPWSVAVAVTVVIPFGNGVPDGGLALS